MVCKGNSLACYSRTEVSCELKEKLAGGLGLGLASRLQRETRTSSKSRPCYHPPAGPLERTADPHQAAEPQAAGSKIRAAWSSKVVTVEAPSPAGPVCAVTYCWDWTCTRRCSHATDMRAV